MHFFKIPKLGAYLAVPLILKDYFIAQTFDDAVKAHIEYNENLKAYTDKKASIEETYNQQKELDPESDEFKEAEANYKS